MSDAASGAPRPFIAREYVRWGDVDMMGIIRYDAYLRFYEFAESELFRQLGLGHQQLVERWGLSMPRKVMHAEFVTPARLDERLTMLTYISAVGTTSLTLNFDILAESGEMRASGYLVLVCVDVHSITKRPIPPEAVQQLAPYRLSVEAARAHIPPPAT